MFVRQLSEEAYLETVTLHGDIDFYQDRESKVVSYRRFVGYISLHKDSVITNEFRLIYDPVRKLHFIPVRYGQDGRYRFVFREELPTGDVFDTSRMLEQHSFDRVVSSHHDTVSARIYVNEASDTWNYYSIGLEDDVH